jgi:K+-sensing histidine kinase KdpD
VALDTHLVAEWSKAALEQFLKPGGLCVFTAPITSEIQRDLFDKSSRHAEICQLMSPSTVATIRRILVLCDQTEIGPNYLASAARICEALETTPIVLVAAHTEREAQLKRAFVEGVCSSLHLEADFDSAVHSDVAQAVGRVVSWRSCTHVILERHNDGAWWQRVRAEVVDKQHALSSPIGVLALPEAIALEVPHKMRSSRTILPWTHRARNEACSRAGATK